MRLGTPEVLLGTEDTCGPWSSPVGEAKRRGDPERVSGLEGVVDP